jgi:hypothetical protein
MKKNIDIKDSIIKPLKVAAAWRNLDLKNYIQDELIELAKQLVLYNQNFYEKSPIKYLDGIISDLKELNIFEEEFTFSCYSEHIFMYNFKNKDLSVSLSIINENKDFFDKMPLCDILDKTPFYLDCRISFSDGSENKDYLFRIGDTKEWDEVFGDYEDMLFRLEFNEEKQKFHLDRGTYEENTNGWMTISESITNTEFQIFESFYNSLGSEKRTVEEVKNIFSDLKIFLTHLKEYNITLSK